MARYRKKPVEIEAFRVRRRNDGAEPFPEWFEQAVMDNRILAYGMGKFGDVDVRCEIHTLEGVMVADEGDYIIRGVQGELYPCKPEIFEATYESADTESEADELRDLVKRLSDKLHYGEVYQWDDGDPLWNDLRRAAGEPEQ